MKTATFLGAFVLSAFCASAALLDAADANQIRQLTVDEARRLAQDQSGRLLLNGLVALAPDVAKELAKQEGWLSLNGLTVISEEAAKELGQHKGFLHLDGLKALSDEVAAALAGHRGELALNDLPSLSDKSAEELARHSGGRLLLKGLTTLSPAAARAFLKRKGGSPSSQLHFDGLTTLAPEAAAALVEMHGHNWNGRLPAFKTVPNEVARALAKEGGALRAMPGLTTISSEAAKALVPRIGGELPELQSLTPEVAKVLAQARGHLVCSMA